MRLLFLCCLLFRIINAALVQTFFDPDEFWQGPEVAHKIVFGYGHLTWEWAAQLRSILHPLILSLGYWPLKALSLDAPWAVAFAPRLVQAVLAAVCDSNVYGVAQKLFGKDVARLAMACQLVCWFNFYCLIRTYSNAMEACLVAVIFNHWPTLTRANSHTSLSLSKWGRPAAVFLVGVCTVLRPTSAMLWIPIGTWIGVTGCSPPGLLEVLRGPHRWRFVFCEVLPLAIAVVGGSLIADRWFYGMWTFPPWQFIRVNLFDGLSLMYGAHPWHWYFTQGFPAMLGTMVCLFVAGCYHANGKIEIAFWAVWYLLCHSFVAHKEFRFALPALVLSMPYCGLGMWKLTMLCAPKVKGGAPQIQNDSPVIKRLQRSSLLQGVWRIAVTLGVAVNVCVAVYLSFVHQRGSISSLSYLRGLKPANLKGVLFLMPCHSMPLYSSLHRNIPMRFLDCSPEGWVDQVASLNSGLGSAGVPPNKDESIPGSMGSITEEKRFLENPSKWLLENLSQGAYSHVIGCDSIMKDMTDTLEDNGYTQQTKFFNSHTDMYGWDCSTLVVSS